MISGNLSVDQYRPGRSDPGYWANAPTVKPGPARATVTSLVPRYNIAKGIRGPSMAGPFTVFAGATWGYDQFGVGGLGAGGHNQGLT